MIEKVIGYLKADENVAGFKLSPNKDPFNIADDRFPEFERRPKYGNYRHSMQVGIWRKDIFIKTWRKKESPWDWEIWGTYRSIRDKWDYYCLKDGIKAPIEYGYDFDMGGSINVTKGKWNHGRYEAEFDRYGIQMDFDRRGWCTDEDKIVGKESFIYREICRFRSLGVVMWLVIAIWRLKKNVIKKMGFPVHKTYMSYKRNEINQMV